MYTIDDILMMKAGDELNKLVALDIMHDSPGQIWFRDYSTDRSLALEVAEKFIYYEIARFGKRYDVYIEDGDDDDNKNDNKTGHDQSDDLCLSICRAAVIARLGL
jgi:hypothetical protein